MFGLDREALRICLRVPHKRPGIWAFRRSLYSQEIFHLVFRTALVSAVNALSGTDAQGAYFGTVAVVDPALNVYRVAFDYALRPEFNAGTSLTVPFAGLAVLTDAPTGTNRRLIAQVNSPASASPVYLLTLTMDRQ